MDNERQLAAQQAANALLEAVYPGLLELGDKPALPSFVTLAKPYLRTALSRVELPGYTAPPDARSSPYHVSAMFWDIDDGMENAELIAATDEQGESREVWGMGEALKLIWQWIQELHSGEDLSEDASLDLISKRVGSLKTAIMRGNGQGEFRVNYVADGYKFLCHATVKRVMEEETGS